MSKLLYPKVNVKQSRDLLIKDARLAPFVASIKTPKLTRTRSAFRDLLESIIYQQLSGKAAKTISERFFALYGEHTPTPLDVFETSALKLRSVGLSEQKAEYIHDLANKFIDRTISPHGFSRLSDREISLNLMQVKGIGQWTADMFLIFSLNRANILPVGDLAIRKGFQVAFGLKQLPDEQKMFRLAKPYEGHWTALSLYLWKVADNAKSKK